MKLLIHFQISTVQPLNFEMDKFFNPHFTRRVITYQCWDWHLSMLTKGVPIIWWWAFRQLALIISCLYDLSFVFFILDILVTMLYNNYHTKAHLASFTHRCTNNAFTNRSYRHLYLKILFITFVHTNMLLVLFHKNAPYIRPAWYSLRAIGFHLKLKMIFKRLRHRPYNIYWQIKKQYTYGCQILLKY